MKILQSYDDLLELNLIRWTNQNPDIDKSVGSMVYFLTTMITSMQWGIYRTL